MEPGWVPMFAGKCSAAEVLPKQLLMLPSPNSVSGGILLPAGTCPEWEEIGEGQTGDRRGGRGIGVGAGTCLSSPPRPTIPSRHSCRCSYQPENFFQLMVKPKEHCPSSSKCWELTRWDGSMGFWALDTAAWYSPEKLPWLSASDACILEPSSFSHQPVTSYCGGKSRCVLGGCLHTDPTPAPQAEPPTRTPPSAHGVPTPALPGELCDPRTHLPVPVATCAASPPVHGTSARHQWGAHQWGWAEPSGSWWAPAQPRKWHSQSPAAAHLQGSSSEHCLSSPTLHLPGQGQATALGQGPQVTPAPIPLHVPGSWDPHMHAPFTREGMPMHIPPGNVDNPRSSPTLRATCLAGAPISIPPGAGGPPAAEDSLHGWVFQECPSPDPGTATDAPVQPPPGLSFPRWGWGLEQGWGWGWGWGLGWGWAGTRAAMGM